MGIRLRRLYYRDMADSSELADPAKQSAEGPDEWLVHMRSVPVPLRLQRFPKDSRGYVIAYTNLMTKTGHPYFLTPDENRRIFCVRNHLCGLCGEPLAAEMVGIGGLETLQDPIFSEAFMHWECADYAARTCPFLAHARFTDCVKKIPKPDGYAVPLASRPRKKRPDAMIFYVTDGYKWEFSQVEENGRVFNVPVLTGNPVLRSIPLPPRFGDL